MKLKMLAVIISFMITMVSANTTGPISGAYVYLYDVDHPEWLSPVSETTSDGNGDFQFSTLMNSTDNGSAYTDGDPIPDGNYTLLIYKPSTFDAEAGITTDPIVAVKPYTLGETESLLLENLEVEASDITPNVVTMFGMNKNTDGTYTWGPASLPTTGDINVVFDHAMSRGSIQNITVSNQSGTTVDGDWLLSADWKTATFKPTTDLAEGTYSVSVPSTVTNAYGNAVGYDSTGSVQLSATTQSYTIALQTGWQLLGATSDISVTVFDNAGCVDYIWKYNSQATENENSWQLHISNNTYSTTVSYGQISNLIPGDGFWVKANGNCTATVNVNN